MKVRVKGLQFNSRHHHAESIDDLETADALVDELLHSAGLVRITGRMPGALTAARRCCSGCGKMRLDCEHPFEQTLQYRSSDWSTEECRWLEGDDDSDCNCRVSCRREANQPVVGLLFRVAGLRSSGLARHVVLGEKSDARGGAALRNDAAHQGNNLRGLGGRQRRLPH